MNEFEQVAFAARWDPSSVVVNTQDRESRGSGFETFSGVWYPVGSVVVWPITPWLILLNWLGNPQF